MKNKRPGKTNVFHLDQLLKRRSKETTKCNHKQGKVINMMTYCAACESQITIKNKIGGFYLCNDCSDLTPPEIYVKVADSIENDLRKEIPSYIDWDEEDLDYLYYTFWCEDENPPIN